VGGFMEYKTCRQVDEINDFIHLFQLRQSKDALIFKTAAQQIVSDGRL